MTAPTSINANTVFAWLLSNSCSGHAVNGTKAWLAGLQFQDPLDPSSSVDAASLSNAELAAILDPTSDLFRWVEPAG